MSYANIIFSRFDFLLLQIVLQEAEGSVSLSVSVACLPYE